MGLCSLQGGCCTQHQEEIPFSTDGFSGGKNHIRAVNFLTVSASCHETLQSLSSPPNLMTTGVHQLGALKGYHEGGLQEGRNCWQTGDQYSLLRGLACWAEAPCGAEQSPLTNSSVRGSFKVDAEEMVLLSLEGPEHHQHYDELFLGSLFPLKEKKIT